MKHSVSALLAAIVVSLLTARASAQCQRIETSYLSDNLGAAGGQIFFNLQVTNPGGITITTLGTNTNALAGAPVGMNVYMHSGSFGGTEHNVSTWTLMSSSLASAAGSNLATLLDIADITLAPGMYAVALVLTTPASHRYSGHGAYVPQLVYSNADLTISGGDVLNIPWHGTPYAPRMWNGSIIYNCASAPVSYCTAGTSSHGCVPAISATSNPSVSHLNACVISVAQVEGHASGVLFYGISQTAFAPSTWGHGSTSFLCMHAPTQRTHLQNTGGNVGQCDGVLTLDWNAFQATHPSALGAPWTSGSKVYVQGLYRDELAVKGTNLSDALELTYTP